MYDYSKIDKKVNSIVKKVSLYMPTLSFDEIEKEIFKAYVYSRDAHE
jgi:hypothetical protein